MSEYQFYEFQALDRPLTDAAQEYIKSLSRRVQLTPTQAVFTYSHGDFPGDPEKVLAKHFDAMLYLANWGTMQLVFRFPRAVVAPEAFAPYCLPDAISVSVAGDFMILDIAIHEEEGGEWIEGEGQLSVLVPLRQDLLRGDFRVLYLAWLKAAQLAGYEEGNEDLLEPPVPAHLQNLSAPLRAFVALLDIDADLLAVDAEASASTGGAVEPFERWVEMLPEAERNQFLVRVARGEPLVEVQLVRRLREVASRVQDAHPPGVPPRRPFSALLEAAQDRAQRRQEQRQSEAQQARIRKLEALAQNEAAIWEKVSALIQERQPKAYDAAVAHLKELRDLAKHRGQMDCFQVRVNQIRDDYRNRPSLLSRLREAGLVQG